jgi:hypothetical protein
VLPNSQGPQHVSIELDSRVEKNTQPFNLTKMEKIKMNAYAVERRMKVVVGALVAVAMLLGVLASTASAQRVVAIMGHTNVAGEEVIVEILVVVHPGENPNAKARATLKRVYPDVREIDSAEFSTTDLVWDQFRDGRTDNDFVTQNYNDQNDPVGALTALKNTQGTWTEVSTSIFAFKEGEPTDRCPSLVRECRGKQTFDGNNDVGWLSLKDKGVLAVTWFGTSIAEADIAMNTNFSWATDGANFDVETVLLHENGHVVGLGHSAIDAAIMAPFYDGVRRALHLDDIAGIESLYPDGPVNNAPVVTITSPADGLTFDSGITIDFMGAAIDTENGDLTADLVWTSDLEEDQIGTGGSFSTTLSDGTHTITASVIDSGGKTGSTSISITVGTPPSIRPILVKSIDCSGQFNGN